MLERFRNELRSNARLRIGCALVVAVLWLYGILLMRDRVEYDAKRTQQLELKVERIKRDASQTDWPKRADSARALQVELESRLWQNNTPGLAQAAFQDWLSQLAVRASLSRPSITLAALDERGAETAKTESEPGQLRDLWRIRAKLEFDFNPQVFNGFMAQIAANPQYVSVETLNIRKDPIPRVEAVVAGTFQKSLKSQQ